MHPRLLHILNLDTVGGVEQLFVDFLRQNACRGTANHLLVTNGLPHPLFKEVLENFCATTACEKYCGSIKIPSFFRSFKKQRYVHKVAPQLVVLWNRFEETSYNIPRVYYEHGASWIERSDKNLTPFFSSVSGIIANSHAAKRLLELKWQIKNEIHVVHNPLRIDLEPRSEAKTLSTRGDIHLGYIGRLINLKGVCLILHAIVHLKAQGIHAYVSIAGDGPLRLQLEKEAHDLGVINQVNFFGTVSNVQQFYDSIDLLIVPSLREPLGLVAQEAHLRGCPVIATAVDGLVEVVQDRKTGFTIEPELTVQEYVRYSKNAEKLPDCVYDPVSDTLTEPKAVHPEKIAEKVAFFVRSPSTYTQFSRSAIDAAMKRPNFVSYEENLYKILQGFV